MNQETVRSEVRQYIIQETFAGDVPPDFSDDTPLVTTGIMDSISTLHLVNDLEQKYMVEFEPHEVTADNLESVSIIADFIWQKIQAR